MNSHPKFLPRAQTEHVWRLKNFASSFSPSLCSFLSWPEPAAKVPGEKKRKEKKNLFSLYFWIWAQVCEGFGKDLQTFERIRVEIWGNPPPSFKKQVALARNWAKIGRFNWGFLWDFGFEPETALWESNFALTLDLHWSKYITVSAGICVQPSESRGWLRGQTKSKPREDPAQSLE